MKSILFENFPQAIYDQQISVIDFESKITSQKQYIEMLKGQIESTIASTPELKNEQQRKAYRINAMKEPDFLGATNDLIELEFNLKMEIAKLAHLRDCFSIVKINKRMAIAQISTGEIAA